MLLLHTFKICIGVNHTGGASVFHEHSTFFLSFLFHLVSFFSFSLSLKVLSFLFYCWVFPFPKHLLYPIAYKALICILYKLACLFYSHSWQVLCYSCFPSDYAILLISSYLLIFTLDHRSLGLEITLLFFLLLRTSPKVPISLKLLVIGTWFWVLHICLWGWRIQLSHDLWPWPTFSRSNSYICSYFYN